MRAEIKVMCLSGKNGQRLPANHQMVREDYEQIFFRNFRRNKPLTLDLRLSHAIYSTLLLCVCTC